MAAFQYKSGTWQDIPDVAHPDDQGSISVEYPEAADRDGMGNPCGAVGLPRIVVRSSIMTGTGWNWWQAFFANATALSAAISVTAFDPRTGTWPKWAGTLIRPTAGNVQPGATAARTLYQDVEIVIEQVASTT